ncbi:MAG: FHA domain-containing protein, partial [Nocardioidaceae bacterium]
MRLTCSVEQHGAVCPVLVEADPESTVSALRAALAHALGAEVPSLWLYDRLLDDTATVVEAGLCQGGVLAFGAAARTDRPTVAEQGWELHVVGGPDAGTTFPLPVGSHVIGRLGTLVVKDSTISRRHVFLEVTAQSARVLDAGSSNGSLLDGEPLPVEGAGEAVEIVPGQLLHIGDSLLTIRVADRER